jgi:hypothetical protein
LEYEATAKPQNRLNMHLVPIFLVMNPTMPMASGVYRPCDELCNFSFVLLPGHRVSLPKSIANINNPLYINVTILYRLCMVACCGQVWWEACQALNPLTCL